MDSLVRWFMICWVTVLVLGSLGWLWNHFPLGLLLLVGLALLVFFLQRKERQRRERQGYWAVMTSEPEVFVITYHEPGRSLQLFGEFTTPTRSEPVLVFPSPSEWRTRVPDWAQEHRDTIIARIIEDINDRQRRRVTFRRNDSAGD